MAQSFIPASPYPSIHPSSRQDRTAAWPWAPHRTLGPAPVWQQAYAQWWHRRQSLATQGFGADLPELSNSARCLLNSCTTSKGDAGGIQAGSPRQIDPETTPFRRPADAWTGAVRLIDASSNSRSFGFILRVVSMFFQGPSFTYLALVWLAPSACLCDESFSSLPYLLTSLSPPHSFFLDSIRSALLSSHASDVAPLPGVTLSRHLHRSAGKQSNAYKKDASPLRGTPSASLCQRGHTQLSVGRINQSSSGLFFSPAACPGIGLAWSPPQT